jgi:hypothetical protein
VLALAGLLAAVTDFELSGRWHGVFLVRGKGGAPLVVKDDLLLGDGSRLLAGVSLSRLRSLLLPTASAARASLELDWSVAEGNGLVRSRFADGTELVTVFSRFDDDEGHEPRGLFVGGALPDVAASAQQDESGMSFRDGDGWHHIWCSANELLLDLPAGRSWYPGAWRYLGGRVLIQDSDRIVLESSHAVPLAAGTLRVDRYAYFRAGLPWFKLGMRFTNAGEQPVRFAYAYGDEPWVGHFGSAAGNVGWLRDGIVRVEGPVPRDGRFAGIFDEQSRLAAFAAWAADTAPDRAYFANQPGSRFRRLGQPLASNEVFVGLEWLDVALRPGESRSILLTLGMAKPGASQVPSLPDGALP